MSESVHRLEKIRQGIDISSIHERLKNLKDAGYDGEILEVNQGVAYFSYSNRLLNGLDVTTQRDTIGYYKKAEIFQLRQE